MTLHIEPGAYYRTREGNVVGPLKEANIENRAWEASGTHYNSDGKFLKNSECQYDLISRVYVSDTPPNQEEHWFVDANGVEYRVNDRQRTTPSPEPRVGDVWQFNSGAHKGEQFIILDLPRNKHQHIAIRWNTISGSVDQISKNAFVNGTATRLSPPLPVTKLLEGFINVFPHNSCSFWEDEDSAKKHAKACEQSGLKRIACIPFRVHYTEGEGL